MFAYYDVAMFAASPSPTMISTTVGGRPKAAHPLLRRRPKAASIIGDVEPAHIVKSDAKYIMYQILAYFQILSIPINGGGASSGQTNA